MNSCEEAVCYVSWMASHDGNNSTEFQISEYVSVILSFLGMKSTPEVYKSAMFSRKIYELTRACFNSAASSYAEYRTASLSVD